jgi:Flp pilus assembly protein TadG
MVSKDTTARRGSTLIYLTAAMTVTLGFLAFGVDYGRAQSVRLELQTAVDAAARHAATGLKDNTAVAKAIAAAAENRVAGTPLAITAADVQVGNFVAATRTFTVGGSPANAVRVFVDRNDGKGFNTTLAQTLGISRINVSAQSFATDVNFTVVGSTTTTTSNPTPVGGLRGFFGTDWFNLNGPLNVQPWDSNNNTVPAGAWAVAQTKGPTNLNSGVVINGELQTSSSVSLNSATITRGVTSLTGQTSFSMPTTPSTGVTNRGNYNGPSGSTETFPAGKYYFDSFQVPAGKTVIFSGPVELYVNGSTNITGAIQTSGNKPSNLKIFGVSSSGMDIGSNAGSPLYAEIYAPNSPMNLNQRTYYGNMVVKGISVNSSFNMYIDARSTMGGFASVTTTSTSTPATPRVIQVRRPSPAGRSRRA